MSTRLQVLLLGTAGILVVTLLTGYLFSRHLQASYEEEVANHAKVLLAAVSVPCIAALASNRLEELDWAIEEFRSRMADSAQVTRVAVLDSRLRVVGHTDPSTYGRILDDPFSKQAGAASGTLVRVVGEGSAREMLASIPLETSVRGLPGIRWGTLTARLGMGRVDARLGEELTSGLGILGLLAVLCGLLLYAVTERTVLRPVARLTRAAEMLGKGDLGVRVGATGTGELQVLGQTFNQMAEQLERHTAGLQHLVDERTQELHGANEQLKATMTELSRSNERLEELVRTDALTGLWNHRHMAESLTFHVALARRGSHRLAFAMVDVDHFKRYNDTHGHPAGDEVLRGLAGLLRRRVRQTDLPCRYGGEEFAILLPDTDAEQAFLVCEDLRRMVAAHPFPGRETQPGGCVSVSVGVAELGPEVHEPLGLVKLADAALYRAKQAGRDRTEKG
jgi:diguanylate cyclase (GGDEF)-like protein